MADASTSQIFAPGLLEGQVCVVSGAGSGMGARPRSSWRRSARPWLAAGAARSRCGDGGVDRRRRRQGRARALDIRDEEAVEKFFDGVVERHGRLDLLVNNAGGQFMSPAEAITPKGFRTVIELNVQGTWLMTHAAATKAFIPQESGKVISVTLSPPTGCGHGPLRRRPRRGREHDEDAFDRVGALQYQALRGCARAVRHRDLRTKYRRS